MSSPAVAVSFSICPPGEAPACDLLEAMVAELHTMYGAIDGRIGVPLHVEELAPPGGCYLVGRVDTQVVAGGGLRTLEAGTGEVKRMYVVPEWRGQGLARLLLGALEQEALSLGLQRVRLDTGPEQHRARHLYLTAGYVEIGNYNASPHASFWGEKELARRSPEPAPPQDG